MLVLPVPSGPGESFGRLVGRLRRQKRGQVSRGNGYVAGAGKGGVMEGGSGGCWIRSEVLPTGAATRSGSQTIGWVS